MPKRPPSVMRLIEHLNTLPAGETVTTRWLLANRWISKASLDRYATHRLFKPHKIITNGKQTQWKGRINK